MPFVIFSMPQSECVKFFLQKDDTVHTVVKLSENGFILAPYDYKDIAFYIPEKNSEIFDTQIPIEEKKVSPVVIPNDIKERNKYIKLLDKTIETINNKNAEKIVLSRFKDFELENFSLEKLIRQLFSVYPTAFKYIWYHPNTGLWCGATPETLVEIDNNSFKTMALAGTQVFKNKSYTAWGQKEQEEQQLVTDSITTNLQKVTSVLKVSNPYTHRAGQLLHLRTDISGILKTNKATLTSITSALHPTPAVCGTPKKFAKEFLNENEGYNRAFYTGFIGPITNNGTSTLLMVNLRCMKIEGNIASVFAGGGITHDSQSIEEWEETQNKMQTMLQVLQPML
ncbi:isochorismate synthase [Aequorivita sp. Q41]|uniref:isochorismate synthase n=1 Tax=Aequorivita sp. Q41 TaxID=3153300 RepID=UPI0032428D75